MTSNCLITEGSVPSAERRLKRRETRGQRPNYNTVWLVVWSSRKNMKVNGKDDNPYIMENKTCSKPPSRYGSYTVYTVSVTYVKSHWSWKFLCFPSGDHYVKHCFKMLTPSPRGDFSRYMPAIPKLVCSSRGPPKANLFYKLWFFSKVEKNIFGKSVTTSSNSNFISHLNLIGGFHPSEKY